MLIGTAAWLRNAPQQIVPEAQAFLESSMSDISKVNEYWLLFLPELNNPILMCK